MRDRNDKHTYPSPPCTELVSCDICHQLSRKPPNCLSHACYFCSKRFQIRTLVIKWSKQMQQLVAYT